jgi:hypothetical protein
VVQCGGTVVVWCKSRINIYSDAVTFETPQSSKHFNMCLLVFKPDPGIIKQNGDIVVVVVVFVVFVVVVVVVVVVFGVWCCGCGGTWDLGIRIFKVWNSLVFELKT